MRLKAFAVLVVMALAAGVSVAYSGAGAQAKADPISGVWNATFESTDSNTFSITFNFKLDGDKVTGGYESPMGTGAIKGTWLENKLNLSMETSHGAIAVVGGLKDGKLVGAFDASGHMKGEWEAVKK